MSDVKYIHFFGTSLTNGGGFEFDSTHPTKINLKKIYQSSKQKLTQFNFSYPGQLRNILKENGCNVEIINHSKSGFGNESMYRKTFDIIYDTQNDLNEHLFIYEFSFINRREYYLNEINDYVILNYRLDNNKILYSEIGNDYYYDSGKKLEKIERFKDKLLNFFKYSANEDELIKETERNNSFFYSFLKQMNVNFLFTNPPETASNMPDYQSDLLFNGYLEHSIRIHDGEMIFNGIYDMIHFDKYSIKTETNNQVDDFHFGLKTNNLIAKNIYNTLIEKSYIKGKKVELDGIEIKLDFNYDNKIL